MRNPTDCRYTDQHEWAKLVGADVRIGITDYAQTELGDVVFVDLPAVGKPVTKGAAFCNVESVKAVSDIYAPVDGTVTSVNDKLVQNPELINSGPYADGWIALVTPTDPGQLDSLKSADEYSAYVAAFSK